MKTGDRSLLNLPMPVEPARQEAHQQFIDRIHTILLAMSEEGRSSLLSGLEEFVEVGLRVQEIHPEEEL